MMNRKNAVRIIALVLAVLLVGSAIVSALMSAYAEEAPAARDEYTLSIEFMEDEQALRISQRLIYTNRTDSPIDRVLFYLQGNTFRRESTLIYESGDLDAVFPGGYAPGGILFSSITVNGEAADWGVQGAGEGILRVACALGGGQSCEFAFEFYVLLGQNSAFLGIGETDWRLSSFFPVAAGAIGGQYITNAALPFARTMFAPLADYAVDIVLPEKYQIAAPGESVAVDRGDGTVSWHIEASAHEFALSIGKRWREYSAMTESGVAVRVYSANRSGARRALDCAVEAIGLYEAWFGAFPYGALTIAQSDYPLEGLTFDGLIWLSADIMGDADALKGQLRARIAQQYFGIGAYVDPAADAWLCDSLSAYVGYLALEELEGADAFLSALNAEILPSLQLTMAGGLNVTSAAGLFSAYSYEIVVIDRGAAVMHELRSAMGRQQLVEALRTFYEMGRDADVLGEYDLVDALDLTTGGDWEMFLTEWLFNIGDYAGQAIDWYE